MTKMTWMLGLLSGLLALACSGIDDVRKSSVASEEQPSSPRAALVDETGDVQLALSEVPAVVKQAALAAVPGLVLTGAERETEHGCVLYSLAGTADDKKYEVEVSPDGKVLEVEQGDDDGDDHGDGDDDDDDKDDDD